MGAGQSTKEGNEVARGLVRRAFSKEHGRDPTKEEEARFMTAFGRDDPMDAHLGPVEAEEADAYREGAKLAFIANKCRDPTDDELSTFTDKTARAFRRAAIEAVEPDVAAVRRELVRRAVEAAKASGGASAPAAAEPKQGGVEVVPFGPPPRPDDAEAAETPFEEAARREHDKVLVVAAAAYQTMCTLDDAAAAGHHRNLQDIATSDGGWDKQTEVARGLISGLGDEAPCRVAAVAAVDVVIKTCSAEGSPTSLDYATSYATLLERTARDVLDPGADKGCLGSDFDMPSLSSDDAADIVPSVENTSWDEEEGCIVFARRLVRLYVLGRIRSAVAEKKKHDAAVEREAARVRLKQQEASSLAAEADLLAMLDAEAATAPKSKSKKKKKKKKAAAPAPVAAPAEDEAPEPAVAESPAVADDWETAADAGTTPAPLEEEAAAPASAAPAEETAASAATDAPPEPNAWKTPVEAETPAEAPAPAEEDAWETVGRRPRRASDAAPAAPVRRRTVINVNKAEGYCFVQPDAGGTNVFLSFKERYAQEGDRIEYELVPSGRPERHAVKAGRAVNLSRATEARAPDWWCAACETNNFAARPACRRCGAARAVPKDEAPVPAGRFTGVVVGAWRGCFFVRGEDGGEDLLLHADDLDAGRPTRVDLSAPPCNAILAVGDRVCYTHAPARYADRLAYYRLKCVDVARAPPVVPDAPPSPPRPPAPADPDLLPDEPLDPPVARLLASLGLESVGPVLMREEVDWESLCLLDTDSLVGCGVDAADARRICERVELAKAGAAPVRAASDPERECPICFEPERSTALVPCGHILCRACAAAHESCPVCRAAVTSRLRLFH